MDYCLDAVALLERHAPGPELAHAYVLIGGQTVIAGDAEGALEWTKKGLRVAEQVGSERFVERARQFRGMARCQLGDFGGLEDMRVALRVAVERGWTRESGTGFNNYASWVWLTAGAREALPHYREGIDFARRRGANRTETWTAAESTWPLFDLGEWDELLATVERIEADAAVRGAGQSLLIGRTSKARVLYYRGDVAAAAEIAADVLPRARAAGDPQIVMPALTVSIVMEPDPERVCALADELLAVDFVTDPHTARACIRVGALDIAERMTILDESASPRSHHAAATVQAMLAEARGERDAAGRRYAEAAQRWLDHPAALERGLCLLGVARTTGDEAAAQDASAIFRSLGAHSLAGEAAAAAA
jgi:hypothetical protein